MLIRLALAIAGLLALAPSGAFAQGCVGATCGYVLDAAPLSASDHLSREIGMGIGGAALDSQGQGIWLGGYFAGGQMAPSGTQEFDHTSRGLVAGYGFGTSGVSGFAGFAQGVSDFDDDLHQARIRSYFLGLAATGQRGGLRYDATIFVGRTHNKISSPDSVTGSADHDGQLLGLSLRGSGTAWQGPAHMIDFVVQGDVLRHKTGDYPITGPGGEVDAREVTASALRVELGMPLRGGGTAYRPYLAYTAFGGAQDRITFQGPAGTTTTGAAKVLDTDYLAVGMTFEGARFDGRVELAEGKSGNGRAALSLSLGF